MFNYFFVGWGSHHSLLCGGQRLTCTHWFSSSTMCVPGRELRPSDPQTWQLVFAPTEPSHWSLHLLYTQHLAQLEGKQGKLGSVAVVHGYMGGDRRRWGQWLLVLLQNLHLHNNHTVWTLVLSSFSTQRSGAGRARPDLIGGNPYLDLGLVGFLLLFVFLFM